MKTTVYTIFLLLISSAGFSQSCQQKLEDAKRASYNGQLQQVETLLAGCLDEELDNEDRFDAYKLMVDAKLLQNDDAAADNYMQKLLALDPNYQPKEVDLEEFKQLYTTYDLRTRYAFGVTIGVLRPDYVIIKQHSYSGQAVQPTDYDEKLGFIIGVNGSYELVKSLYADISILFQQRGFKQEEVIMNFRTVTSTQRDYLISLPMQLKYLYRIKNFGIMLVVVMPWIICLNLKPI